MLLKWPFILPSIERVHFRSWITRWASAVSVLASASSRGRSVVQVWLGGSGPGLCQRAQRTHSLHRKGRLLLAEPPTGTHRVHNIPVAIQRNRYTNVSICLQQLFNGNMNMHEFKPSRCRKSKGTVMQKLWCQYCALCPCAVTTEQGGWNTSSRMTPDPTH